MRRLALAVLCAMCLPLSAAGIGFTVGGGGSTVSMGFLNMTIQALAEREAIPHSTLRLGWNVQAGVWLSPSVGAEVFWVASSGGIGGRDAMELSATAVGVGVLLVVSTRALGLPLDVTAGIGLDGCWASATGMIVGQGFGWGATVRAGFPAFRIAAIRADVQLFGRYLLVPTIRDGERVIDTGGLPAMDFSGVGIGLTVRWGP